MVLDHVEGFSAMEVGGRSVQFLSGSIFDDMRKSTKSGSGSSDLVMSLWRWGGRSVHLLSGSVLYDMRKSSIEELRQPTLKVRDLLPPPPPALKKKNLK